MFTKGKGSLKQILLLTDGCSNEGNDPIAVASMAREHGITVNVIGVLDDEHLGSKGKEEIIEIAKAGQGIHQLVYSRELPKTVQMVTRKAMNQTIQQVVNKELAHILGKDQNVQSLAPEQRSEVVEAVENMSETMSLDVLVLVDTSASMKHKLPSVKQALRDLSLSLQSRIGDHRFSLWVYPGKRTAADRKMKWSTKMDALEKWLSNISTQGTTPTGPALAAALEDFYVSAEELEDKGAENVVIES